MGKAEETLIANIRSRLEELDWSVADLARAAGLSPSGMAGIVKGDRFPGPDNLDRLAKALRWPLWRLFADAEDLESAPAEPHQSEIYELAVLLASIDDPETIRGALDLFKGALTHSASLHRRIASKQG